MAFRAAASWSRSLAARSNSSRSAEVCIYVPTTVALYILNQKRESLAQIEARYGVRVMVARDDSLIPPSFRLERLRAYGDPNVVIGLSLGAVLAARLAVDQREAVAGVVMLSPAFYLPFSVRSALRVMRTASRATLSESSTTLSRAPLDGPRLSWR